MAPQASKHFSYEREGPRSEQHTDGVLCVRGAAAQTIARRHRGVPTQPAQGTAQDLRDDPAGGARHTRPLAEG